jgi:hypothetical protein
MTMMCSLPAANQDERPIPVVRGASIIPEIIPRIMPGILPGILRESMVCAPAHAAG